MDAVLARRLNTTMANTLGSANVVPYIQHGMGGEDFAYFVEPKYGVKGYYFAVGGTPQAAFDSANAGGSPVTGATTGPVSNPTSHGDPTNPSQPR